MFDRGVKEAIHERASAGATIRQTRRSPRAQDKGGAKMTKAGGKIYQKLPKSVPKLITTDQRGVQINQ